MLAGGESAQFRHWGVAEAHFKLVRCFGSFMEACSEAFVFVTLLASSMYVTKV